ncbi:hypothetical protein NE237_020982 [Protea cynaroides]|uniref:Uncharacterized protein n=1 Tax=Protea cynaroides TaxID=273540 RepID=A0A9Q0H748_9MAGN|nr:hypothetical protein NE237_020982 [Protea cynaroides]
MWVCRWKVAFRQQYFGSRGIERREKRNLHCRPTSIASSVKGQIGRVASLSNIPANSLTPALVALAPILLYRTSLLVPTIFSGSPSRRKRGRTRIVFTDAIPMGLGRYIKCSLNARDPGILHAVLVAGLCPMVGKMLPPVLSAQKAMVETANGAKDQEPFGAVEVRATFSSGSGRVAGCMLIRKVEDGCNVKILRNGKSVHDGVLDFVKRMKQMEKVVETSGNGNSPVGIGKKINKQL